MSSKLYQNANNSGSTRQSAHKANYQVPSQDGRFIKATPCSLCIKYKPPTIAVVYTMSNKGVATAQKISPNKKFVHNILIDFDGNPKCDLELLVTELMAQEPVYLNPQFIQPSQVMSLLEKLFEKEFSKQISSQADKENQFQHNERSLASNSKQESAFSNNEKRDLNLDTGKDSSNKKANLDNFANNDDDSDWDFAMQDSDSKKNFKDKSNLNNQSPDKLLNQNTDRELESEGGFNLDELPTDQFNNEEDKFNKIMDTKDHKGLLASIGLKNANSGNLLDGNDDDAYADDFDDDFADDDDNKNLQIDDQKKQSELSAANNKNKKDIFDTSGTRDQAKKNTNNMMDNDSDIGGDNYDFDLNNSDEDELDADIKQDSEQKTDSKANPAKKQLQSVENGEQQDMSLTAEEEQKAIEDQFQLLYDGDEELRRALAKQDVSKLTQEEKYQIIEAYMEGNGASGLQFEIEDEDNEEGEEVDPEVIEEQFKQLYEQMPELQEMYKIDQLTIEQKYQFLMEYTQQEEDDDQQVFVHEGKTYRKVEIEGMEGEYLMDEEDNIYDMNLNKKGNAGQ